MNPAKFQSLEDHKVLDHNQRGPGSADTVLSCGRVCLPDFNVTTNSTEWTLNTSGTSVLVYERNSTRLRRVHEGLELTSPL